MYAPHRFIRHQVKYCTALTKKKKKKKKEKKKAEFVPDLSINLVWYFCVCSEL